ncbi:hypothetical protein PMAYCL1PPCAC_21995, partial [Pristionchus mayeri]
GNRPRIKGVELGKIGGRMNLSMVLYPSNLHLYDISTVDSGRFTRWGDSLNPRLDVTLCGPEDPVLNLVSNLLSSFIKSASIYESLASIEFALCANILCNSTFGILEVRTNMLNDTYA